MTNLTLINQGAEANIYKCNFLGKNAIVKERCSKSYRHFTLDKFLNSHRMKSELKCILKCKIIGIKTPSIYHVDTVKMRIFLEYMEEHITVKQFLINEGNRFFEENKSAIFLANQIGSSISKMHSNHIIHGDLTTSNFLIDPKTLSLTIIDFGLGSTEGTPENKAVDLYVLERAFLSSHPKSEEFFNEIIRSYIKSYINGSSEVINKLEEVRLRGRKRTMVG